MASGIPGIPEQIGEDYLVRRIKALERRVDELGPSLMMGVADAITAVVKVGELYDFSNPFPGTVGTVLTRSFYRTVPVPAGYTRATVVASAAATMFNGGAATEAIVSCGIGTNHPLGGLNFDTGVADVRPFPASQWVQPSAVHMKALTGLDTDTEVAVALYVRTAASVAVTPGTGTVMATIIFTR